MENLEGDFGPAQHPSLWVLLPSWEWRLGGLEHSGETSWRRSELELSFQGQVTRKFISEYRVHPSRQRDGTSGPVSAKSQC